MADSPARFYELKVYLDVWQAVAVDEQPPVGISVRGPMSVERYARDLPALIGLVLEVAVNVPVNLLSSWLYDLLRKHGCKRVRIERTYVEVKMPDFEMTLRHEVEETE